MTLVMVKKNTALAMTTGSRDAKPRQARSRTKIFPSGYHRRRPLRNRDTCRVGCRADYQCVKTMSDLTTQKKQFQKDSGTGRLMNTCVRLWHILPESAVDELGLECGGQRNIGRLDVAVQRRLGGVVRVQVNESSGHIAHQKQAVLQESTVPNVGTP